MVQAMINIGENTNRVLNIIKAKFSLNDKSEAIDVMAQQYEDEILEPELRPEFIKEMLKLKKTAKFIRYKDVASLRKELEKG
ncbi:DUF2683 family protein [Candidatus Woesearchaeota archaeon]|nr:DUF2683 family protein [Candidatus Woesearchaeota archaeon]